ncbi:3993_t:CDS:2 [Paraglomus brasilianum]|uniref:3993_t:CDS:1 n=1 Tax=Paraglomus brasilianum TaxID=144538 RepID=A0A9N9DFF1_9GLOM|nr:3993_t:CDS:2 [Paraglomus brasilianum]
MSYEQEPLLSADPTHDFYNTAERDIIRRRRYGWYERFRRSQTAVVLIAAMALFTDMVVYGIVVPILPLIVKERLELDSQAVGFLFGCYALGLLGATPFFAILSDRYHTRKLPMLLGMGSLAICTLFFGIANTYWQLVIARIAQGAAGGASWTISLAMLADRFGQGEKLGVVMGTVLSANTIGAITGPIIGGALYQYWGYASPFIFCAILAFFDFLTILMIIEPHELHDDELLDELLDDTQVNTEENVTPVGINNDLSLWSLIRDWNVITVCIAVLMIASVFSGIEPILPIYLKERFNTDPTTIGFIYISVVIPTIISPIVGSLSQKVGQWLLINVGMILLATSSALIALPFALELIIASLAFFGAAYSVASTPTLPLLGEFVTKNGGGAYGQVYALWNMAYSIGMLVGPVIGGVLLQHFGFFWAMMCFATTLFVTALFIMGESYIFLLFANADRGILPDSPSAVALIQDDILIENVD